MLVTLGIADDAAVVTVCGDLDDASTTDFVGRVLDATSVEPGTPVVVDLSQVEFCDGAGLLALAELERALAPRPLAVRAPRRAVDRLLVITGYERLVAR
jgi:anti-anti-sigma factor